MRVTNTMQFNAAVANIQQQQSRLQRTQEEASSGKKVLRPSDDPVSTRRILALRQERFASAQFQRQRDSLTASLGITENAMQGIETAVQRAKEIALNGANGSLNAQDRETLGQEVTQIFNQVVQLGNTALDGRFLFAGRASTQPPFTATGTFTGDSHAVQLSIDTRQSLDMDIVGSEFLASDLRPALDLTTPLTSLHRGTMAPLGSIQITDRAGNSATIDLSDPTSIISINDVLTAINGAGLNVTAAINATEDGIVLQDSSLSPIRNLTVTEVGGGTTAKVLGIAADRPGDIIGAALQPAVTLSAPLITLYGGEGLNLSTIHIANGSVEFDVDLSTLNTLIPPPTVGDVVNAINSGSTSASANVTASINSNGTALDVRSTDPATVAVVTDVAGGTSAANLGIQGSHDLLKTLSLLQEALAHNDSQAAGNLATHLDAGFEQMLALRGEVGARMNRLELVGDADADRQLTLTSTLSQIEDVDAAEAYMHLLQQSTAFQAALASTARLVQPTLLDFLR
jgi:flagellar hook-associated protein 3 FlgL